MREHLHAWLKSWSSPVFLMIPLVLAVIGPFGTYFELTFLGRLGYWSFLVFGIGFCMVFCIIGLSMLDTRKRFGLPAYILAGSVIAAIPGTAIVYAVHEVIRDISLPRELMFAARLWAEIAVMGVFIAGLYLAKDMYYGIPNALIAQNEDITSPESKIASFEEAAPPIPRPSVETEMHLRLADLGSHRADIVSLSMQDHYVEITTTQTSHLVLMRMSDAVSELDGLNGLRIHRSHWVALDHMRSVAKDKNRYWLTLSDGRRLPVSQTYLDNVQTLVPEATAKKREAVIAP